MESFSIIMIVSRAMREVFYTSVISMLKSKYKESDYDRHVEVSDIEDTFSVIRDAFQDDCIIKREMSTFIVFMNELSKVFEVENASFLDIMDKFHSLSVNSLDVRENIFMKTLMKGDMNIRNTIDIFKEMVLLIQSDRQQIVQDV